MTKATNASKMSTTEKEELLRAIPGVLPPDVKEGKEEKKESPVPVEKREAVKPPPPPPVAKKVTPPAKKEEEVSVKAPLPAPPADKITAKLFVQVAQMPWSMSDRASRLHYLEEASKDQRKRTSEEWLKLLERF